MDFFESQDQARKRSAQLVFFYLLAVVLIVVAVYFVVLFTSNFIEPSTSRPHPLWDPVLFFGAASVTLAIIALGSGYRILQLRSGGGRVAEMMGGRRIDPGTQDPDERRLVNVVEEMAIASGVPVPEIFVMDREEGINAFAAGYSPSDAAVAVTAGTLRTLNRDELQGVIAHEFSHILNGDMRLNIRLIGVLNGILILHLIGLILVRSLRFSRVRTSRDNKGGGGAIVLAIIVVGISLMIIGYIGVLFSRIIQAAISRQREFLADAAAVQFTRNPDGIANALKKIGGASSKIQDPHATEASHLFFANGLSSFSNLFATHPPLVERIRAIDPSFDGKSWIKPEPTRRSNPSAKTRKRPPPIPAAAFAESLPMDSALLLASVGRPAADQIEQSGAILEAISQPILDSVHNPAEAEAAIYSLVLSDDEELRTQQFEIVGKHAGSEILQKLRQLHPETQKLPPEARLPLVDLALPALKQLSETQYRHFRKTVNELSQSDGNFSIFEFALEKVLLHHLERHFNPRKRQPAAEHHRTPGLAADFTLLLSALAHSGDTHPAQAFEQAKKVLPEIALQLLPKEACTLARLDAALDRLNLASYPIKKQLLTAAIAIITADGKIHPDEGELLRAISASLDCPMPPLIHTASQSTSA